MNTAKQPPYREDLPHFTKAQPYSVHTTGFSGFNPKALYLHWHPEAELFYLAEGKLNFYIENTLYQLKQGDAIFIPPNLLHQADAPDGSAVIFHALVFSTDLVVSPEDSLRFKTYIQPVLRDNSQYALHLTAEVDWQRQIIDDLKRVFSQTTVVLPDFIFTEEMPFWSTDYASCTGLSETNSFPGHTNAPASFGQASYPFTDLLVEGFLRVIWQQIHQHHLARLSAAAGTQLGKMEDLMQNVISYIQQNYMEEITLEMLARTAHVSKGQLCRSFRQLTGSTPFTWLKKYRIMKSCEWLLNTDKKISEICSLCGFNNISYYNREFLKIMKVTPSSYRKNRAD